MNILTEFMKFPVSKTSRMTECRSAHSNSSGNNFIHGLDEIKQIKPSHMLVIALINKATQDSWESNPYS